MKSPVEKKDIGEIDENLTITMHMQNQVNKTNIITGLIRISFRYMFQALVRPHLEYAEAVWTHFKVNDKK